MSGRRPSLTDEQMLQIIQARGQAEVHALADRFGIARATAVGYHYTRQNRQVLRVRIKYGLMERCPQSRAKLAQAGMMTPRPSRSKELALIRAVMAGDA